MARAKGQTNGQLDEAMAALAHAQATLVQTQASLVQTQQSFVSQLSDYSRRSDEKFAEIVEWQRRADERFARLEAILLEHSRTLHALPDAVRDKIGFKSP